MLLEALSAICEFCRERTTLVLATVHLCHTRPGSSRIGEADGHDAIGLCVEEYDVFDWAEFAAFLLRVFDNVFGEIGVLLELLGSEHVLEDDDLVPAIGCSGHDRDIVLVPVR